MTPQDFLWIIPLLLLLMSGLFGILGMLVVGKWWWDRRKSIHRAGLRFFFEEERELCLRHRLYPNLHNLLYFSKRALADSPISAKDAETGIRCVVISIVLFLAGMAVLNWLLGTY